ncbi:unnamed protein product [Rotaria socialis]|uniref:Reverse transcriptase domain-containing protein n=4 Tax=Rotaria socialis TaxID=392032 RepID=A0A817PZW1_9BILA|nr:unnamed protein product [Rotaria socialis]
MVDQINQAIDVVIPCKNNKLNNKTKNENDERITVLFEGNDRRRPLYEITGMQYFDSIQKQLQTKNRILLPTYNTNAYYSCEIIEMQQKISEHMTRTNAYRFIMDINETNQPLLDELLLENDKLIATTLNNLFHTQCITYSQWQQMIFHRSKSEFDLLYFLPDTRQENIPFHPMILDRHPLTMNIARFITQLIQPLYDHVTSTTTFHNSADVLDAVEDYVRRDLLKSNTLFANIHIHDLTTSITLEILYDTLQRFLIEFNSNGQMQNIKIPTILYMVRLCLEPRYVIYDNKFYQQVQGGGFNSPLIMLLSNICLFYWQQNLVNILNDKNEIFGRYNDELFFTWNKSEQRLQDILHVANQQWLTLQMRLCLSSSIHYLDIILSHTSGQFKAQVALHSETEHYSLPYVFGHSVQSYVKLFQAALLRIARCYTDINQFAEALGIIQLSFRYNGFDDQFIGDQIQIFLNNFKVPDLKVHCGKHFYKQPRYDRLHYNVTKHYQKKRREKIKLRRYRKTLKHQCQSSFMKFVSTASC